MKWKLYYGDGTTFCDEDGAWEDAPSRNVQALVTDHKDVGYEVNEGSDGWLQNYIWWPGAAAPWGTDSYGTLDYLVEVGALEMGEPISSLSMQELIDAGVKIGRTINTSRFVEIHMEAAHDDYFPPKSARTRKERVT